MLLTTLVARGKRSLRRAIDSLQGSLESTLMAVWHTFEHGVKLRSFTKFLQENSVAVTHMFGR